MSSDNENGRQTTILSDLLRVIKFCFFNLLKFFYGFLFGLFIWQTIVQPYERFLHFQQGNLWPMLLFSTINGLFFMVFRWVRSVMVLFIPNLVGSASQNYVIVMLFIGLFSNPIANIALNAVESARVVGCSMTMSLDIMKDRAKLVVNPIKDIFNETNKGALPTVTNKLFHITQLVGDLLKESSFNDTKSTTTTKAKKSDRLPVSIEKVLRNKKKTMKAESFQRLVNETKRVLGNSSTKIEFDFENFGIKAKIDPADIQIMRSKLNSNRSLTELNLTDILHQNCLNILKSGKDNCQLAVEDLRLECKKTIGPYFASLWCSPVTFTLTSLCPWMMNQILDEKNMCNQMRDSLVSNKIFTMDGRSFTGNDINQIYKNLTRRVNEMQQELVDSSSKQSQIERIELSITFNKRVKDIFADGKSIWLFITDKYKMRQLFYDIFLFVYEIYTTITFLIILREAAKYHRRYQKEIKFDNNYITTRFKELDEKRRALKKSTLLPLTKDESENYITTFTCKKRTHEERKTIEASRSLIVIFLVFTSSIMYLDNIFYYVLNSVREHALISYKEVGHHNLDIKVKGDGSLAQMVKRLIGQVQAAYHLDKTVSTKNCLPVPNRTKGAFYIQFLSLVLSYTIIDMISIYAMRLRSTTCAYFYPELEKRRIDYLYNYIAMNRARLRKSGLSDYVGEDEPEDVNGNVYTIKDAFRYISGCISESLTCDCSRIYSRDRG